MLNSDALMWAGFNIATELLSSWASKTAGTGLAGAFAPAGVQVAALQMYHEPSKRTISKLTGGDVFAITDNPFLAGSVGGVVAKLYA